MAAAGRAGPGAGKYAAQRAGERDARAERADIDALNNDEAAWDAVVEEFVHYRKNGRSAA
jgi:hypothetical protein